jgi:hypothetical protein
MNRVKKSPQTYENILTLIKAELYNQGISSEFDSVERLILNYSDYWIMVRHRYILIFSKNNSIFKLHIPSTLNIYELQEFTKLAVDYIIQFSNEPTNYN